MTGHGGRALIALGAVGSLWILGRASYLFALGSGGAAPEAGTIVPAPPTPSDVTRILPTAFPAPDRWQSAIVQLGAATPRRPSIRMANRRSQAQIVPATLTLDDVAAPGERTSSQTPYAAPLAPGAEIHARKASRPTLSAWLLWRHGSAPTAALGDGQLGGSQMGARLTVPVLRQGQRLTGAITARASAPLATRLGREVAFGLSARRQGRVPIEIIAERRIAVDRGGRDAFALMLASGFDSVKLGEGFQTRGYAQAGMVGLRRRDIFIDGAVSVSRPLARRGGINVEGGAMVAGGAQPGLTRIDAGPELSLTAPDQLAGTRLSLQWRFRVAGNARPASGPAIVLGADF